MNIKKLVAAISFCLVCSCAAYAERYAEGEAIVVFSSSDSVKASVEVTGASITDTYEALSRVDGNIFVRVKSETKTTEELIAELNQMSGVIAASPNWIQRLTALTPNDKYYGRLWGTERIKAPEVWSYTTGSDNVYVAVIDSGVYPHDDLKANLAGDLGLFEWEKDFIGHGTHVAGTIGAVGNNSIGITGINWKVKIIPINVVSSEDNIDNASVINALDYLAQLIEEGITIAAVNMSFAGYNAITPQNAARTSYYLAFKTFDKLNKAVIVVSAGNKGLEIGVPAPFDDYYGEFEEGDYCYPASFTGLNNMIVVGATDEYNGAPGFTNWGERVTIAAPGEHIYSTYSPYAADGSDETETMYHYLDGTSMAAPHVTGAVALLKAKFPSATPSQIRNAIISGANTYINPTVYPYTNQLEYLNEYALEPYKALDGAGKVSGSGLLDIKAAMDILEERSNDASTANDSSSGGCTLGLSSVVLLALLVLVAKGVTVSQGLQ